jgi:hypothetical protein
VQQDCISVNLPEDQSFWRRVWVNGVHVIQRILVQIWAEEDASVHNIVTRVLIGFSNEQEEIDKFVNLVEGLDGHVIFCKYGL